MSYWLTYLKKVKQVALIMKVLNIQGVHGGILSLLIGGLVGCTPLNYLGLAQLPITPIRQISPQSATTSVSAESDDETLIYLEGKVVDLAPFMDSGSYQLQDETGTVWVLTDDNLPQTGEQIIIKGKVAYESIAIGNQELGELYVVEVEKVEESSSTPTSTAQPVSSPEIKPKPQTNFDELLLPHKRHAK